MTERADTSTAQAAAQDDQPSGSSSRGRSSPRTQARASQSASDQAATNGNGNGNGNGARDREQATQQDASNLVAPSLYGTGPDTLPGAGDGEEKQPPTWNAGIDAILAHHGAALEGPAVDFIRRALGELYQHQSGGPPASEVAKEFAEKVGDADWLNSQGREHQQTEGLQLNGRGIPLQQAVEITPADQGAPSPQAAEQERDPQLVRPTAPPAPAATTG